MKTIKIFFDEPKSFKMGNIKPLDGIIGLYFIFNSETEIHYPFERSGLIYISMSEKQTNSIGKRLSDHYDGKSGNPGLVNYRKVEPLYFTYINFEMLKKFWEHRIEDLESYVKKNKIPSLKNNPIIQRLKSSSLFIANKESHASLFETSPGDLKSSWKDVEEFESLFF